MSHKDMTLLLARLVEIDAACTPERKKREQAEAEANVDEFTLEKRQLANTIRDIRLDIAERDKFLESGDRARAAEKSAHVRKRIKAAEAAGKKLESLYASKHSKLKAKQKIPGVTIKPEKVTKDVNQKKVVELTWQHLKDLERREQHPVRTGDLLVSNDDSSGSGERVVVSGIADIDDPQFELLRQQDELIEGELDKVLQRLKALAVQAGEEINAQGELIDDINEIAESTAAKLETVNHELKKTLRKVRSARNLCCDLILLAVILGIATAIYFLLT